MAEEEEVRRSAYRAAALLLGGRVVHHEPLVAFYPFWCAWCRTHVPEEEMQSSTFGRMSVFGLPGSVWAATLDEARASSAFRDVPCCDLLGEAVW